jgi:DNA-binding NtrC family response regulator
LLISDVGMPAMSGWQLAENIKGKYPDMKVALCTGWGDDVSSEKKERYGVGYVLGKPTSMDDLKNLIREVLQSKD